MESAELHQQFVEAEHLVEVRSGELKKELRLGDLVLSQALYIIGIQWLGTAGLLGSAHRRSKHPTQHVAVQRHRPRR